MFCTNTLYIKRDSICQKSRRKLYMVGKIPWKFPPANRRFAKDRGLCFNAVEADNAHFM